MYCAAKRRVLCKKRTKDENDREERANNDPLNVRMRTGSELNLLLEDFNKNCFFQEKPKKTWEE